MSVRQPPQITSEVWAFLRLVYAAWQLAGFPAVTPTSWYRDRAENARVGGHPNSQHLRGTAVDVLPDLAGDRFVAAARMVGLVPIDEGDHWHVQTGRVREFD